MSISSHTPESSRTPEPLARASRTEAVAQWRRRSRLIHFLRKALPAMMAALGLLLVGWVGVKSLLASLSDLARAGALIHMTNPHFYGQDDHGRAFVVTAREAQRSSRTANDVRLIEPDLNLAGSGGRSIQASAQRGFYQDSTRRIALQGNVHFATGDGTDFRTQQALIDMRSGTVTGNSPVQGAGPLGQISASSYAIYDRGAQVVFDGQVHAHLVQRKR
jgi:lipopolysaccharide export system protein LptC